MPKLFDAQAIEHHLTSRARAMDLAWDAQASTRESSPAPPGMDISALGDAITLGTMVLQGEWMIPVALGLVLCWFLLLMAVLKAIHSLKTKHTMESGAMQSMIQDLQSKIDASQGVILALQDQLPPPQDRVNTPVPSMQDGGSLDATLLCMDAKLLQVSNDNQRLHATLMDIAAQLTDSQHLHKLDEVAKQALESIQEVTAVGKQTDKAVKTILALTQEIPGLNKLTQSMGLDMKKAFQMQETMSDSLLKQARESLHLLQSDNKSMGEKLTRLEGSADDLKNATKQNSLDVHVCKETIRQKLETMHGEQKHFVGATNSNFRGLNVLIPQFKHLGDQSKDMLDYLVRANQHDTSQAESSQTVMESSANAEDRIVRVESLCTGLIDQVNEINELMQQIREAQSLQQELLNTIVERTPKLPKRSPPQETSQPTTPPVQQQPSTSTTMPQSSHPQVHVEGPTPTLRLSEHLQPLVRETTSPIYMVGNPLNQVSTQDLLRALLSRGGI